MFTRISIQNFRSIKKEDLRIAPITVFYGQNGSGKSTVLYAPAVLKSVVLNPNRPTDAFFNLGFINLGGFTQVVHNHNPKSTMALSVFVEGKGGEEVGYSVGFVGGDGFFSLVSSVLDIEILEVTFPYPGNQQKRYAVKNIQLGDRKLEKVEVVWNGLVAQVDTKEAEADPQAAQELASLLNTPVETLRGVEIAPLKRAFTKPLYSPVTTTPWLITEDEVATFLASDEGRYVVGDISVRLERILGRDFRVNTRVGTAMFSLDVTDKKTGVLSELVNEGSGVGQVVYMLAQALRKDTKIVCIEEPEIHLHPEAVRNLAREFASLVEQERKQMLISTHSEVFVLSLLAMVAEGKMDPDKLACYWVRKKGKESLFERQEVNERGQIEGGLRTFMEAELKDLHAFLRLDRVRE